MSSLPAVSLSQDLQTSVTGINLKWAYTALSTIKEISLIYFKNSSDADIVSVDIASGLVRCNLPPSGFVSGQSYSFQMQVVDISSTMVFSNTLVLTAPWTLAPPVISSVTGLDEALLIQLSASANVMSSSDTTIEFVLKREDNVAFWLIKPYTSSGQYTLSASDDARLTNNVSYRVACMFQPSASNTRYTAPSALSNSITATPSNTPNAPQSVTCVSSGVATRDLLVSWVRPNDFSEWSSGSYSIVLRLENSLGDVVSVTLSNMDITSHAWTNVGAGLSYQASVQYINQFGAGPIVASTGFVTPTSQPDAPVLVSVQDGDQEAMLTWSAPSYFGQSAITGYKLYKDGSLIGTVSASTFSLPVTGLYNGFTYSFYVVAVNAIGSSVASGTLSAKPYGQMSIVSVVASAKTLTATINPNGRPVDRVLFIALDGNPNDAVDGEFVAEFTQQQISQVDTQNITVIKTFSQFSSDVSFYCAIAHNAVNSAFLKSP